MTSSTKSPAPATGTETGAKSGTFTLLLFASAASYADDTETLTLVAPTTFGAIFQTLETRFPGFMAKVLTGAAVTLNLEYVDVVFPDDQAAVMRKGTESANGTGHDESVDGVWASWMETLEGWRTVVEVGDEVGVIPPVSSG